MYYNIYDLYDARDFLDKKFGLVISDEIMEAIRREVSMGEAEEGR